MILKIIFFLFIYKIPKNDVIFDFCSFDNETLLLFTKFNKVGRRVNVITNEVIKPKVIIQPKSIIGFISLKINDRKAQIVVSTV